MVAYKCLLCDRYTIISSQLYEVGTTAIVLQMRKLMIQGVNLFKVTHKCRIHDLNPGLSGLTPEPLCSIPPFVHSFIHVGI